MKRAGAAIVMLGLSGPAHADFHDGNALHAYCQNPRDRGEVMIYASGVAGGLELSEKKFFCIPKSAKLGQLGDIVCRFLDANPETRHFPGAVLVARSLRVAWPCSEP